ncbi:MAG: hypothetical protein ACL93V_06930 [Candidatus Electrothrix sp. YB6]
MAIDYFLTLHRFGSDANEVRVREFLLHEFPLTDHVDTGMLTGPGLSVNVFIDDDNVDGTTEGPKHPDLVISFRISKHELDTHLGYQGMRRIVDRVVRSFDVELRVGDEFDQYFYLTKTVGKVVTEHRDHDFWTVGTD